MKRTAKTMIDRKAGFALEDHREEKLHMITFQGAELHGVDLRDASLQHVNFVGSKWEHIYFADVHVNRIQLGGTLFENIMRPDAPSSDKTEEAGTEGWINVDPVVFRSSDLSEAVFEHCKLRNVDLRDCDVEGMRINGIPLEELLDVYRSSKRSGHGQD
ncbi:pentapeptide repeat-containing protein [Paenibacillus sp. MBLB4367]|uniref:pentapeptide repeat-containing protein n=1 Tax=Paenibacillus sp. MBLB4367 TaxID=3384767 RepID=UPI003908008C